MRLLTSDLRDALTVLRVNQTELNMQGVIV